MAFLQPSFMEAKPEQQEKPSRAPSPTVAKVPKEPTSFQPLMFSTVVNEEEALSACQEITRYAEDVISRLDKALPAFLRLLTDEKANPKIKAKIFR